MKRLFLFVFSIASISLSGQGHFIGTQGGVNFSKATNAVREEMRFNTKFAGGLVYEYVSPRDFIIETDLLFYQAGFYYVSPQTPDAGGVNAGTGQFFLSYNYISLPLKAGYKLGSDFFFTLKGGIAPSYLLKATHTSYEDESEPAAVSLRKKAAISDTEEIDNENNATKFDWAALAEFGLGYDFKSGINLNANIGFRHSLTELSNEKYFEENHFSLYGFTFSLGLKYKL
jgi:hypothetical protein